MAKLKFCAIIALLLLSVVSARAYDFKDNDCYYTITSISDMSVALTNSGEMTKDKYGRDTPVACYSGDFTVPQTVQYSGKTFTVTQIDGDAFTNCVLGKLTIPFSVTSALIGGSVQELVIEDSNIPMTKLRVYSVKNAYVGRDVDYDYSFAYSKSLQKVVFGNNVTSIPGFMFEECENLEIVEIPNSVKRICHLAFAKCFKLNSIKAEGVEVIENYAFEHCNSLESFDFPALIAMGYGAFQSCISLKSIEFSEGVREIERNAFNDCKSLERIKIPATIEIIGYGDDSYAFANCPNLKEISIAAKNPIQIGENTFNPQTYINATLKVPEGALEAYKTVNVWKNFFNIETDPSLKQTICLIKVHYDAPYSGCDWGSIEFLEKVVDFQNSSAIGKVQYGGDVTLKFSPKKGYCVGKVTVNGEDYTSEISDNILVISKIEKNINVNVEFEEEPIYLTLKQADNGALKMQVGNSWYKFFILPSKGYDVHSISFNGQDITSSMKADNSIEIEDIEENSELIVTYKDNGLNGINTMKSNSMVRVYGAYGRIVISNATMGDIIEVYDMSGKLVDSVTAMSIETTIDVMDNNVYIVKVGSETFKVGI